MASAVDEADTSDSEETFVYESNPPESHPSRHHRYHSRTPSTTSMGSQIEGRPRALLRDTGHSVTGKRSMKFANNAYNSAYDGEAMDQSSGGGGSRSNGRARHYHTGRHNRHGGHPSVVDQSPFMLNQHPKSPRHFISNGNRRNMYRVTGSPKKNGDTYGYDFDGEGADDERTPLVGSVRYSRNRHGRRPNSANLRHMEYIEQQGCFSRYGFCAVLFVLAFLLFGGATTFFVGLSKPLVDVYVKDIQNVLASEQEIMLDLDVRATNPNLFTLSINDMDVNIFARSRFVSSDAYYRSHGLRPDTLPRTAGSRSRAVIAQAARHNDSDSGSDSENLPSPVRFTDGVDKGTDPIFEDPSGDPSTMLLGRIFHFDSPLTFDSSPWQHRSVKSMGEVRLPKPGNRTEEGGSERWERVLQHPFELIVRGVLKYQLPLSSHARSASISSKVKVNPDEPDDPNAPNPPKEPKDGKGGDDDNDGDGDNDDDKHGKHGSGDDGPSDGSPDKGGNKDDSDHGNEQNRH